MLESSGVVFEELEGCRHCRFGLVLLWFWHALHALAANEDGQALTQRPSANGTGRGSRINFNLNALNTLLSSARREGECIAGPTGRCLPTPDT